MASEDTPDLINRLPRSTSAALFHLRFSTGPLYHAWTLLVVCCLVCFRPLRWDDPYQDRVEAWRRFLPAQVMLPTPTPTPTPLPLPERARVPILMYHYVSEPPVGADRIRLDLTVTPENFRAQLRYLADAGYHTITLSDLYLYLTQGIPLPDKPVVLTFDDGYRDAYEVVFPMLQEYGFTGTFFVLATPAHFESPGYLTWAQMKEMAEGGMDIQAHGRDHVDLRGRSYDYLVYQILGIQEAIYYHTGRLPRFFCYPSGRYDKDVIAVLKSAGYWGAVTTEWGYTHSLDNIFTMPRIRIRGSDTLASFVRRLEGR
ncbi:MAG: polysaccharide deacetylase family protein [Anaerolineae bacterium]|nr:polysaccharide deacetylase family protein [Anaerolineae bacterium]